MKLLKKKYETIEKCNNIQVNLRHMIFNYEWYVQKLFGFLPNIKKKKYIFFFFFYKSETVISFIFWMKPSKLSLGVTFVEECYSDTRFIALFYVKNEVSTETMFIFIFYCATVSRENWMKLAVLFYRLFWHQK